MILRSKQNRCTVRARIVQDGSRPLLLLARHVTIDLRSPVLCHYEVISATDEEQRELRKAGWPVP